MTNLRDSMKKEASEKTERAKLKFAETKEKMMTNLEEFSENAQ